MRNGLSLNLSSHLCAAKRVQLVPMEVHPQPGRFSRLWITLNNLNSRKHLCMFGPIDIMSHKTHISLLCVKTYLQYSFWVLNLKNALFTKDINILHVQLAWKEAFSRLSKWAGQHWPSFFSFKTAGSCFSITSMVAWVNEVAFKSIIIDIMRTNPGAVLPLGIEEGIFFNQARAWSARARRACALRALGLLLADGTPTVGGGKTFWWVSRIFLRKQL